MSISQYLAEGPFVIIFYTVSNIIVSYKIIIQTIVQYIAWNAQFYYFLSSLVVNENKSQTSHLTQADTQLVTRFS